MYKGRFLKRTVVECVNQWVWNKWLSGSPYDYLMSAASSCNTYSKTLAGIDEAGKQLADEVSPETYAN